MKFIISVSAISNSAAYHIKRSLSLEQKNVTHLFPHLFQNQIPSKLTQGIAQLKHPLFSDRSHRTEPRAASPNPGGTGAGDGCERRLHSRLRCYA